MECLSPERGVARRGTLRVDVHSVFEGRCSQHAELRGKIVRQVFDDDRVATERHVRAVLLAGADWDDEPGVASEHLHDFRGAKLLQAPRSKRSARLWRGERLSHSR
jgi:hypothetical protein